MITLKDDEIKVIDGKLYYVRDGKLIRIFAKKNNEKKVRLMKPYIVTGG